MSFYALISGSLTADPQARDGQKGRFATATIRAAGSDEHPIFASAIAFGEQAEHLLAFAKGDAIAVGGRAKLNNWIGRDDREMHGISIVVSQIASAKPAPRPRAAMRRPSRQRETSPAAAIPDDRVDDLWELAP